MSDWQRVQQLFLDVVDLPPLTRSHYLEECCAGDRELHDEIKSLLAADLDSGTAIEAAVQDEAVMLLDAQVTGARFGTYVIVREIGRGGMGTVYLANRDDHEYEQKVALKIVKRGMDTSEVLERFRYERQILARLEHPNIARLIDGGSTADGVPFFVMEYIEGKPLDVFCRETPLSYELRCRLFLKILDAVAYAHRSLVVHRDLKPANILVAPDGVPKLLDFGVAKLLSGDPDGNQTLNRNLRLFTPGYASPEQVLGLPITTATDIYSLGAIFYELLTGKPAQPIRSQTPSEIERVVCYTQITRPSLLASGLPSDLDNIVLMAMRKEPGRRYLSAVQFAEDIRRHLDGRPVIARQNSLRYRTAKFVRRNRLQVAAASLVLCSLVAGFATSTVQMHRAQRARVNADALRVVAVQQTSLAQAAALAETRQRQVADEQRMAAGDQRDQAVHQRAIADQRSKDILELANRTLFDIHDAIAILPGSVDARRTLVKTTLDYLEELERQAGLDDAMRLTLAAAYFKVAMMQGNPQGPSLQDFALAEKSLLKAQSLLTPVYSRNPNNAQSMLLFVDVQTSLANLIFRNGREAQAVQMNMDLLPVAHKLFLMQDCTLQCRMQESVIENTLNYEVRNRSSAAALGHANAGIALDRELLRQYPGEPHLEESLGSIMAAAAGAYRNLGNLTQSADFYRESIAIREKLLLNDPNNSAIRRDLMIVYGNFATLLGIPWSANLDKPIEARLYAEKCVGLAREIAKADANDATARHDLGMSLSRLGMIDPAPDETAKSLASLEEAESFISPILKANPRSSETANQLALILQYEGHRLEALDRGDAALATYQGALSVLQPFFNLQNHSVNSQYLIVEDDIALLDAALGNSSAAITQAEQVLRQAVGFSGHPPPTQQQTVMLARAWSMLSLTQSRLGMTSKSRESAASAMKLWQTIDEPGFLLPQHRLIARTQALLDLAVAP